MIKNISISILTLLSLNSWAQNSSTYFSFTGEAGIVNNSINGEQIVDGLEIGYWDEDFKNNLLSGIENSNQVSYQVYDKIEFGKDAWSLSYQYKIQGFASIAKDIFELGLFGNAPSAGRELSFDNTYLDHLRYSELSFSHKIGNHLSGSISFLVGHGFSQTHFNNSSLFTAEHGEYISYDLDYTHYASDSTAKGIFSQNGLGTALGLSYTDTIGNSQISVNVADIGFIKWNENTQHTSLDEEFHFEGIEIEDILSFNDSLISEQIDTLLQASNTKGSYSTKLPISIGLHGQTNFKGWLNHMNYGLNHRPAYYESPLLYASITKSFGKHYFSCGLRGGGMEKLGVSAAYKYQSKKTEFSLFTQQANIGQNPSSYGFHIGIGIKKVFLSKDN